MAILVTGPGGATSISSTLQTVSNRITLDASQSISSNAGTLTYVWTVSLGFSNAAILGGNTATPTFQLSSRGTYRFCIDSHKCNGGRHNNSYGPICQGPENTRRRGSAKAARPAHDGRELAII